MARVVSSKPARINTGADVANQVIMNNVIVRRGVKEALQTGGRALPIDLVAAYVAFNANLIAQINLKRELKSIEKEEKVRMREIHTAKLELEKELKSQEEKYWRCHRVFSAESLISESDAYRRKVYMGPEPSKAKMAQKKLQRLKSLLRSLADEDDMPVALKRTRLTREWSVKFAGEAEEKESARLETREPLSPTSIIKHTRPERVKSAPSVRHTLRDLPVRGQSARPGYEPRVERNKRAMSLQPEHLGGRAVDTVEARRCGSAHGGIRTRIAWGETSKDLGQKIIEEKVCEAEKTVALRSHDVEEEGALQFSQSQTRIRRKSTAQERVFVGQDKYTETQEVALGSVVRRRESVPEISSTGDSKHTANTRKCSVKTASTPKVNVHQSGEEVVSCKQSLSQYDIDDLEASSSAETELEDSRRIKEEAFDADIGVSSSSQMEFDLKERESISRKVKAREVSESTSKAEMQTEWKEQRRRKSEPSGKASELEAKKGLMNQNQRLTDLEYGINNLRRAADVRRESAPASVTFPRAATKGLSCHSKPLAPRPCEKHHQHTHSSQVKAKEPRARRVSIFRRKSLSASLYGEQVHVESNLRQKVQAFLGSQAGRPGEEDEGESVDKTESDHKPLIVI